MHSGRQGIVWIHQIPHSLLVWSLDELSDEDRGLRSEEQGPNHTHSEDDKNLQELIA